MCDSQRPVLRPLKSSVATCCNAHTTDGAARAPSTPALKLRAHLQWCVTPRNWEVDGRTRCAGSRFCALALRAKRCSASASTAQGLSCALTGLTSCAEVRRCLRPPSRWSQHRQPRASKRPPRDPSTASWPPLLRHLRRAGAYSCRAGPAAGCSAPAPWHKPCTIMLRHRRLPRVII